MEATSNDTAEAWRERITSQQSSGQSIRAWCHDQICHEHAFYWWRARLGLSPKSLTKRSQHRQSPKPLKLVEVVVDRVAAESMCLRMAGGRELILPASITVQQVAALIRALEAAL